MIERTLEKRILEELRDLKEDTGHLLDRMTVMETVVMGINKDNGMNGSVKKIEKLFEDMKPIVEKLDTDINCKDTGLKDRMKESEKINNDFNKFKNKVYAGATVANAFILAIVWAVNKFNLFGAK